MQINGYRLDLGHKGEPHATSYTSHLNTMGVLLKAESNSGDEGGAQDSAFLTSSQVMLILPLCAPLNSKILKNKTKQNAPTPSTEFLSLPAAEAKIHETVRFQGARPDPLGSPCVPST